MRLFEAIMEANHRAVAGDPNAGLHPGDFANELPVAALTCIDPRLNALFPDALGLPKESFIWLRNAGNIIFGSMSTMMRSLALACAVKGGREIAIIGHTHCLVTETSVSKLTESFRALGVERSKLPDDLTDFFGLFASERQNVIKAVGFVRESPLIGSKIPVHGLIIDVETGRLEWVVNGYEALTAPNLQKNEAPHAKDSTLDAMKSFEAFKIGEMKFPETKIGEIATPAKPPEPLPAKPVKPAMPTPPKIPYPPRLKHR
jgi:carbonic anhydrase